MRRPHAFVLLLAFSLCAKLSAGLVATDLSTNLLLQIDPLTGAGSPIGFIGVDIPTGSAYLLTGLSHDRMTGKVLGIDTNFDQLMEIDPLLGAAASSIGPFNAPNLQSPQAIAVSVTGALYAADGASNQLFTIDRSTGAATPVGPLAFTLLGLAFDLDTNILYGAGMNGFLYVVDPSTAALTSQGFTGMTFDALAFEPVDKLLYGLSGNALFTIDPATAAATLIGPTGFASVHGLAFWPDLASVPEPSAIGLLFAGVAALGILKRGRRSCNSRRLELPLH